MAQLELVRSAALGQGAPPAPRPDHEAIALFVRDGASVLDVGCGDGGLLSLLTRDCAARARGVEINPAKAQACVKRGLSVVQGDAERCLEEFPSGAFDYVVFSRTLQSLRDPAGALRQGARVGERVIVSIANSGHWSARMRLLLQGRMPRPAAGFEHLHAFTVRDFAAMAREMRLTIERATPLSGPNPGAPFANTLWRANWFAREAVFLLAG